MARNDGILHVKLDDRSYKRALGTLQKYEGRPFRFRVRKAFEAGARLLVGPMRRMAPKASGNMARSIAMRHMRRKPDPAAIVAVHVKPRSPKGAHGHLQSQGHNITKTKGGPVIGYYEGTGFVQQTIDGHEGRALDLMAEQPLDIRGSTVGSMVSTLRSF